ncbi:MAG: ATP-binding cassette domain-containing protein [Anaerolineae bacterium]|nr:ATP-binding cassette domain-containing protein [Anaerolineae bacterium]
MSNREIQANELVKNYGDFRAVDGISFKVEAGEIFGFLGPNGAGKSTTVAILTTLALPSGGQARVGGYDVVSQADQVRRIAGVALQDVGLDPLMKSRELLMLQAQAFGLDSRAARRRADELLELVKLSEFTDRTAGKYSGGMRRRLDLALALVHEPEILFLDEPTTGLDPSSRRDIWQEVRRLNREKGMTIFLTTQYLEEADELADRIAIIVRGRIATEGTPEDLKASLGGESVNVTFKDEMIMTQAHETLRDMTDKIQRDRNTLRLYLPKAAQAVPSVVGRLQAQGLEMVSLTLTQPTLDDVFLQVTGQRYSADEAAEAEASAAVPA